MCSPPIKFDTKLELAVTESNTQAAEYSPRVDQSSPGNPARRAWN